MANVSHSVVCGVFNYGLQERIPKRCVSKSDWSMCSKHDNHSNTIDTVGGLVCPFNEHQNLRFDNGQDIHTSFENQEGSG